MARGRRACSTADKSRPNSRVVVMTNSDAGGRLAQELLITIFDEYGWDGIAPDERVVVTLDPSQYEAVVGKYRFEGDAILEVSYIDGKLLGTPRNASQPLEMMAESETEFFFYPDGRRLQFILENQKATEAVIPGGPRGRRIN